ncbi:hypothetical protein [Paenarthrobacter ureafaciens]|uniref:hypothetical protein n=1 Tax=Paenarthrobacter ureafaciens TaxID=37931 RepID=UPI00140B3D1A|nr:hypothetical protein [Paenarthrobacter ureafaciens]MCX8453697.1 hypothetical protein [Paenarthrobacter ureafaciens]MCY0973356.1 hypothetical protein [Paenarthrobacter ureafaciens]
MATTAAGRRIRILIPLVLLSVVGSLVASIVTAAPRTPPAMLGASGSLNGGVGRINGVIPLEADGWIPPSTANPLTTPPTGEHHRVRILLELTAMDQGGISFDPSQYSVSGLGGGKWKPLWSSLDSARVQQGQSINPTLVFDLPDRAIELSLDLPGGPGLSLGAGHHRGAK